MADEKGYCRRSEARDLTRQGRPAPDPLRTLGGAPIPGSRRSKPPGHRRDKLITDPGDRRPATVTWHGACLRGKAGKEVPTMYSILYIIGAIVVIIVVLRVLGLI